MIFINTWMSHGKEKLNEFLALLNNVHETITFTMDMEQDGGLPFLEVFVY